MNGSRDGFPPGDEFEGSDHSAEDKAERENPDVNIPPSAHEPYKSLKRFKLVDEFADSEINASFGKTVDAFSPEQQKQNRRRVAVGRKPENARQWQFTMTLGNTSNQCSIFPLLVVSTYYECSGNDITKQRCKTYRSLKRTLT